MMPIGKKGIKRICLYTTALILAVLLLLPFAITPLVNSHTVKSRIAGQIQTHTGFSISPEQIQIVLTPLPGIRVRGVSFELGHGFRLTLETLGGDLDLSQLLRRRISLDRIFVQSPRVYYLAGPSEEPSSGGRPTRPGPGQMSPPPKAWSTGCSAFCPKARKS